MESPSPNMPVGESANIMEKNLDVLEGKWYYFRRAASPDEGIIQYLFSFDEDNPKRIVWSIGYLESEGINKYEGAYEIDEDGQFTANLVDPSMPVLTGWTMMLKA